MPAKPELSEFAQRKDYQIARDASIDAAAAAYRRRDTLSAFNATKRPGSRAVPFGAARRFLKGKLPENGFMSRHHQVYLLGHHSPGFIYNVNESLIRKRVRGTSWGPSKEVRDAEARALREEAEAEENMRGSILDETTHDPVAQNGMTKKKNTGKKKKRRTPLYIRGTGPQTYDTTDAYEFIQRRSARATIGQAGRFRKNDPVLAKHHSLQPIQGSTDAAENRYAYNDFTLLAHHKAAPSFSFRGGRIAERDGGERKAFQAKKQLQRERAAAAVANASQRRHHEAAQARGGRGKSGLHGSTGADAIKRAYPAHSFARGKRFVNTGAQYWAAHGETVVGDNSPGPIYDIRRSLGKSSTLGGPATSGGSASLLLWKP